MTDTAYRSTWEVYQDAWADITTAERQALLSQSLSEDCVFASPAGEGKGYTDISVNIENFQKQYPGASFRTHKFLEHHDQALAEWIMHDKDGKEFLQGKSYARFGPDGRLTHLAGFWEL